MTTSAPCKCNRCRKRLTREASIIKGIGPICEKRGLKSLGVRAAEVVQEEHRNQLVLAVDGIRDALYRDEGAVLEYEALHRQNLDSIISKGSNRIELLGLAYEIMADVCNQLPGSIEVADAVRTLFFVVGAVEESEAAHKRICRLIKKMCVL